MSLKLPSFETILSGGLIDNKGKLDPLQGTENVGGFTSLLPKGPQAPAPPPPPPAPASLAQPSIAEAGETQRNALSSASGEGFEGTDLTGAAGGANPNTTKALLGG